MKDKLLFLDTETTGREEQDRIFQVAYILEEEEVSELFKPPLPISIEAMEATHYTNKDVSDKAAFKETFFYKNLKRILEEQNIILVAHNAPFDIEMLQREDLVVKRFIDTLKVAQYLDKNAKLAAYRLQYLRYALDLDVSGAQAHDALGDVKVLKELFDRLFKKMLQDYQDEEAVIDKMEKISSAPVEIKRITFGKHAGKLLEDVLYEDRGYLEWLLRAKEQEKASVYDQNEDWIYTLKRLL